MLNFNSALDMLKYIATVLAPSLIFMVVSLPVQKRNFIQDSVLALLWFAGLFFPIHYAGKYPYVCSISVSVWAWATAMKMGVWVFCMTMEERQKTPFVYTLSEWRQRLPQDSNGVQQQQFKASFDYKNVRFRHHLWTFIKHQAIFDLIDYVYNYIDAERPIRVFSVFMSRIYEYMGQLDKAAALAPSQPITNTEILSSTCQSLLFCVYIQLQLQVTYDVLMVLYAGIYKCLPYVEKWQLGTADLRGLNSNKSVLETKAILKKVKKIRALKDWIEDTLSMQPLFDSPWSAHSLRDFWGRRWHTFYNESFYRLGYRPIRWTMLTLFNCKPPRWLPALAVFIMSGLMHEFFLYAASGPKLYTGSASASVLPAGGLQFLFFIIQVFGISIGDKFFRGGLLGHIFTVLFAAVTCHLFVVPYLLTGYLYMERFSFDRIAINFYRGNPNLFANTF